MAAVEQITFGPFRLDLRGSRLWRGTEEILLAPKPLALLRHLTAHAGALVTKDELLRVVWPDAVVTEWSLSKAIRTLRAALGDDARRPNFIETVHGRGFRFIPDARIASTPFGVPGNGDEQPATADPQPGPGVFVGRTAELATLLGLLARAAAGETSVVFVTGEAGIGKTALLDAFIAAALQHAPTGPVWVMRGQCGERMVHQEFYMPVLEGLAALTHECGEAGLVELLSSHAPTWLARMPWLLGDTQHAALRHRLGGGPERMPREFASAVGRLGGQAVVLLVIEDLRWSDPATLDLIAYLAEHRERLRLLVLGSYRPADALARKHSVERVKQRLQGRRRCIELPLAPLSASMVAQYLSGRFPGAAVSADLGPALHRRTEGNPLFMVEVVEELVSRGWLAAADGSWNLCVGDEALDAIVPDNLRRMIEQELNDLPPEEARALEAAATVGLQFSAQAAAAAEGATLESVEAIYEGLARERRFLRRQGYSAWSDGTVGGEYSFVHALHRELACDRITPARRRQMHQRIGERLEIGLGTSRPEIVPVLAAHFVESGDAERSVSYLTRAAHNAANRFALADAVGYLRAARTAFARLPDTPEQRQKELSVVLMLAHLSAVLDDYVNLAVVESFTRASELAVALGKQPQRFSALVGLVAHHVMRAELDQASRLVEELLDLAVQIPAPGCEATARTLVGWNLYCRGDLVPALRHLELDVGSQAIPANRWLDTRLIRLATEAFPLALLGYPELAAMCSEEMLAGSREPGCAYNAAFASCSAANLAALLGDAEAAGAHAENALKLSEKDGVPAIAGGAGVFQCWSLAQRGLATPKQLREAVAQYTAHGRQVNKSLFLSLIARVHLHRGEAEEGLSAIDDALAFVEHSGERFYAAELYRLQGKLLLARIDQNGNGHAKGRKPRPGANGTPAWKQAEACFQRALSIARQQRARLLHLRASVSLAALYLRVGATAQFERLHHETYAEVVKGSALLPSRILARYADLNTARPRVGLGDAA